jgi:hypothetical protein
MRFKPRATATERWEFFLPFLPFSNLAPKFVPAWIKIWRHFLFIHFFFIFFLAWRTEAQGGSPAVLVAPNAPRKRPRDESDEESGSEDDEEEAAFSDNEPPKLRESVGALSQREACDIAVWAAAKIDSVAELAARFNCAPSVIEELAARKLREYAASSAAASAHVAPARHLNGIAVRTAVIEAAKVPEIYCPMSEFATAANGGFVFALRCGRDHERVVDVMQACMRRKRGSLAAEFAEERGESKTSYEWAPRTRAKDFFWVPLYQRSQYMPDPRFKQLIAMLASTEANLVECLAYKKADTAEIEEATVKFMKYERDLYGTVRYKLEETALDREHHLCKVKWMEEYREHCDRVLANQRAAAAVGSKMAAE